MSKVRYGDFEADVPDDLVLQAKETLARLSRAGVEYLNAAAGKEPCSDAHEYNKELVDKQIGRIADTWISLCRFQHDSNEHAIMEASGRIAASVLGFGLPALIHGPQAEKEASAYMRQFEALVDKLSTEIECLINYCLNLDPAIRQRLSTGEKQERLMQEIGLNASNRANKIIAERTHSKDSRDSRTCLPLANIGSEDDWIDIVRFTVLIQHHYDVIARHKRFIRKIRGLL